MSTHFLFTKPVHRFVTAPTCPLHHSVLLPMADGTYVAEPTLNSELSSFSSLVGDVEETRPAKITGFFLDLLESVSQDGFGLGTGVLEHDTMTSLGGSALQTQYSC